MIGDLTLYLRYVTAVSELCDVAGSPSPSTKAVSSRLVDGKYLAFFVVDEETELSCSKAGLESPHPTQSNTGNVSSCCESTITESPSPSTSSCEKVTKDAGTLTAHIARRNKRR
jgi:hypothetical protein